MSTVVVATPDGSLPTEQLHQRIAAALPRSTSRLVLEPADYSKSWLGTSCANVKTLRAPTDSPWVTPGMTKVQVEAELKRILHVKLVEWIDLRRLFGAPR